MEGPLSGGASTIQRPQLPPLPAATRAVRGVPDPFRGPAPGTQVEGLAAPDAPSAPDAPEAADALAVSDATDVSHEHVVELARVELPPTPPALKPLAVARKSAAVAEQEAKKNSRVEALRNANVDVEDAPPASSVGVQPASSKDVPRPETPAAIIALEQEKLTGKDARRAKKDKAEKSGKAKAKTSSKSSKAAKTTGSGSSNTLRLVGALAGLLLLAALAFFGSQMLGQGTSVSDLSAGECIESFFETDETGSFIEVSSLTTVDCAQSHAYEVFAVSGSLFTSDEYPGVDASFATGEEFCLNEYETFIGGGRANLRTWEVWTFVPPEASWGGDRLVQCVVGDINQETLVTGSLRGAAEGS